jgi:hypothetical protein
MGAAGSLMPLSGFAIDQGELRRRYSRQLRLPRDASDLRAPAGATEEQMFQALQNARREVLFLRRELFKLQTELPATTTSSAPSEEGKPAPPPASARRSSAFDPNSLEDVCSGRSDGEDLRECVAFVAHVRQLLQRETAMVKRRARRLSHEGRRLISAMLTSDSDTDSDDGLGDLP